MVECDYCGEEFSSETELHAHWEEHEGELNSHEKEKMKKARRKLEKEKESKLERRKNIVFKGLTAVLGLALLGFVATQVISFGGGGDYSLEGQPMLGNESAPVTVVEFADYRCPYCKMFEERVFPKLKENYIETGKVKFYFVNFAFLGPGSTQAAIASECVYNQDRQEFWEFHAYVYEHQGPEAQRWVTKDLLMSFARNATEGLDYRQLEQCISSQKTLDEVRKDKRMGINRGVSSTPSVFVNGQLVKKWRYSNLKEVIEKELGN
ncbi:MAG: thioredoxin domain-containing protein [Candidatus Nanohaloarchaea archaeon]